ncbi:type II toxin-antitoxin system RelE/ParE family toxin [Paraburkholderia panacisoli]|uniref:Type II toxin-antitoxin system RelE/ParE family toxin n=1 Tax=Paraburkholderia panacisoli TaxID=2603818 RepID=A0A5B0GQ37_9BURK|nr:type II toxin-antitoxin system RelE/ParE family toxin [Paraburkholderia panacisoli]KAA1004370.1 type II toxin-antitoxin system RelE/ParE family toxin [Paraburkholderia panacisoli]
MTGPLVCSPLDEAQEDTKDLRRYILKTFGAETWKQTSAELAVTFGNIRQIPQSGYVPAELSDFGGLNFREALSGQNRVIYEVRDDTIYIHVVTDTRRDLRTLLQKRLLRSRW